MSLVENAVIKKEVFKWIRMDRKLLSLKEGKLSKAARQFPHVDVTLPDHDSLVRRILFRLLINDFIAKRYLISASKNWRQTMMEEKRAQQILRILRREFSLPDWANTPKEPFSTLIRTVLSQATNDKNRDKAFRNLSEKFEITPKVLAEAEVKKIEEAIRVGGLYRNKSRVIKELSRVIVEEFDGTLDFVYSSPLEEARKLLMALPGVGPKTADVVLLFCANKPVLPVDTHVNRVSKRLGLAAPNADYEHIRLTLQSFYSTKDCLAAHLLLIMLGREYCKARNPLHRSCPVKVLCPSAKLGD